MGKNNNNDNHAMHHTIDGGSMRPQHTLLFEYLLKCCWEELWEDTDAIYSRNTLCWHLIHLFEEEEHGFQ